MKGKFPVYNICVAYVNIINIPSREWTYPTEREKELIFKTALERDVLVPSRVCIYICILDPA